ncbi:hypothetical protein Bbelb_250190 [Branchiostoma belcheri]|nr:hypothetical protein Bbelb_250190 [Branchiostoma belcheri]
MRNVLLVVAFMMFYIGYRHRGNDVRPSPSGRSGTGNDVVTPAATTHPEKVHHRGRRGILVLNKTPGIEVRKDMAGLNGDHIPQPNAFDINDTVFPDFDMEAIDVNLTMLPTNGNWSLDGDITTDVDFDFFLRKEHNQSLGNNIGADELLQSLLTLLQRDDAVHELETDVEHETNHEDSDDISSNIYLDYQNDGDDEFKVDTEYDFSDHDESEQSDGIKRVIKLDRYAHVVSCQINVACNLGSPNRRCKCRPNNRQKPGTESNASCVFPKARVTHRSLTKKGLLTSFCFGVSLPALGRRYKYDMRTKCTFYGRPNVTYKVYVSKAVKGSARSKKGRTSLSGGIHLTFEPYGLIVQHFISWWETGESTSDDQKD